jgi:hypothetical protein
MVVRTTLSSFMKTLRTALFVTFMLSAAVLSAIAGDPNGVWKYNAETPKGKSVESTLTLKWNNNELSGNVDNLAGKAEIKDAKFADDQISFTVVRKLRRREFTIQYSGKLEGDTITGTVQTKGREDKPLSLPWSAKRTK